MFLTSFAIISYAQETVGESDDEPKEFGNFQQDVFDSLELIFEKNSEELNTIQQKLSDNLEIIFEERSQDLANIQEEVFINLDNIFETNSKELANVQSDLNKSEIFVLWSLAIPTIFFGFYPEPLINTIEVSIQDLIEMYDMNLASYVESNGENLIK